jgi:hypothetical protein
MEGPPCLPDCFPLWLLGGPARGVACWGHQATSPVTRVCVGGLAVRPALYAARLAETVISAFASRGAQPPPAFAGRARGYPLPAWSFSLRPARPPRAPLPAWRREASRPRGWGRRIISATPPPPRPPPPPNPPLIAAGVTGALHCLAGGSAWLHVCLPPAAAATQPKRAPPAGALLRRSYPFPPLPVPLLGRSRFLVVQEERGRALH